jgi:hypothetical protein
MAAATTKIRLIAQQFAAAFMVSIKAAPPVGNK